MHVHLCVCVQEQYKCKKSKKKNQLKVTYLGSGFICVKTSSLHIFKKLLRHSLEAPFISDVNKGNLSFSFILPALILYLL